MIYQTENIFIFLVHPFQWFMCFYVCSEKGGGQDSVLPGAGLRSVLAAPPPQPHPEAHHLRWERSKPLRTAQVWRENIFPKRKWKDHSIDGWLPLQKGLKINVLLCDPFFFKFLFGAGLHRHQHGICELLHKPHRPLHGQQALQELLQGKNQPEFKKKRFNKII